MLEITGEFFEVANGYFAIRTSDGKLLSLSEILREFDIPHCSHGLPDANMRGKVLTLTVADSVDSPYRG